MNFSVSADVVRFACRSGCAVDRSCSFRAHMSVMCFAYERHTLKTKHHRMVSNSMLAYMYMYMNILIRKNIVTTCDVMTSCLQRSCATECELRRCGWTTTSTCFTHSSNQNRSCKTCKCTPVSMFDYFSHECIIIHRWILVIFPNAFLCGIV